MPIAPEEDLKIEENAEPTACQKLTGKLKGLAIKGFYLAFFCAVAYRFLWPKIEPAVMDFWAQVVAEDDAGSV